MRLIGQIESTSALAPAESLLPAKMSVEFEEGFGSGDRVWLRGRLLSPKVVTPPADEAGWWQFLRTESTPRPKPLVQIESRISGHTLHAEVPLGADGLFEAMFTAEFPTSKRGWRISRNQLSYDGNFAEKCGMVLLTPENAISTLIVILPLEYTFREHGAQQLAMSEFGLGLGDGLRQLVGKQLADTPVYYVACVRPDDSAVQSELALATSALGWPTGHFLFLPSKTPETWQSFLTTIDRLRWLFAEKLTVRIWNLEPTFDRELHSVCVESDSVARISQILKSKENGIDSQSKEPAEHCRRATRNRNHTRAGLVPRHPVVFCHGLMAFSTIKMKLPKEGNCFAPLRSFLNERGFRVLFPQVGPTSSVISRAEALRSQLDAWTDEPVNIVAHSMGGLDARYMISHLGMAGRVRTLTTIATPHRGSYLVDWFIANFRNRVPLLLALEAMGLDVNGFQDVRRDACMEFNRTTPNASCVDYFSFAGDVPQSLVTPFLRRAWSLMSLEEGPNDGMVSTASARWGTCLGTIRADHFAQTPDMTFVRPGENFDALGFYVRLIEDLARRGF